MRNASLLLLVLVALLGGLSIYFLLGSPGGPAGGDAQGVPARARALAPGEPSSDSATDLLTPDGGGVGSAGAPRRILASTEPEPAQGAQESSREEGADPEGPALVGSVVTPSGMPVVGAEVRVRAADSGGGVQLFARPLDRKTATDAAGVFRVARGRHGAGAVEVEARARGFLRGERACTPSHEAGPAELGALVLEPGVVLAGVVQDSAGEPVAGAEVLRTTEEQEELLEGIVGMALRAEGGAPEVVETDAEGRFELSHEPAGDYVMVFRHGEHPRGRLVGRTPPAGGEDLGLVLRFPPSARLTGRVEGYPGGIKNAMVRAERVVATEGEDSASPLFETLTGGTAPTAPIRDDGSFTFPGLVAEASYRLQAFVHSGFFTRTEASDEQLATPGQEAAVLTWVPGGRLLAEVRDADTDRPVESAVVRFAWQAGTELGDDGVRKRSFDGGRVELTGLRPPSSPGRLDLLIQAPGRREYRAEGIVVSLGEDADLGVLRLPPAPLLRVRVLDGATGEPIRRARVTLRPLEAELELDPDEDSPFRRGLASPSISEKSERDGWCELPVASAGAALLEVRARGFADFELRSFELPRQGVLEQVVHLGRGGSVEVRVLDSAGVPADQIEVLRRMEGESSGTRTTDSEGRATFANLEPGDHEFRARRPGPRGSVRVQVSSGDEPSEAGDWQRVSVRGNDTSRIELRVPAVARLAGRITSGGGPLPGAVVRFLEGRGPLSEDEAAFNQISDRLAALMPDVPARTRADDRGEFLLGQVAVGEHRVQVSAGEGAPPHIVPVEIFVGDNRKDIELPGGSLEGRVLDPGGAPVPGARVEIVREGAARAPAELRAALSLLGGREVGAETDADGRFLVHGLPSDGPLVARVRAAGFIPAVSPAFEVEQGKRREGLRIGLELGGSIRVTLDSGAGPFQSVEAHFEGEADPAPEDQHVIARGTVALLEGLLPGPWRVRLDEADEGELVEVVGGVETPLHLSR